MSPLFRFSFLFFFSKEKLKKSNAKEDERKEGKRVIEKTNANTGTNTKRTRAEPGRRDVETRDRLTSIIEVSMPLAALGSARCL